MANISDVIESFIMEMTNAVGEYHFNRGELADRFDCVPSQINYVLGTRFTPDRGYAITSRRGGGGYVTVVRLSQDAADVLRALGGDEISEKRAFQLIRNLLEHGAVTREEAAVIDAAISDRALSIAENKDELRLNILRTIVLAVLTEKE